MPPVRTTAPTLVSSSTAAVRVSRSFCIRAVMKLYGGSQNRTVSTRSSCSTVKVSSARSRAFGVISGRPRSRVLDEGALHAEIDCPVIGCHAGFDDVAVAQILSVLGLPGEEDPPLQLIRK